MKIICEQCNMEILDDTIIETEQGAFHKKDCFLEYCYAQYATIYTRKELLKITKEQEEKYSVRKETSH